MTTELQENPEQALAEDIADMTHDPLAFVLYAYPWGQGVLEGSEGPRKWQREILQHIGSHLGDRHTRHQPCLIAVCSGHDIGKSALISMVCDWAMSTCEDCRVIVTANTGSQLATKTVPEVTKWFGLAINAHWFDVKAESITQPERPKLWRTDFVTWSEKAEAFQGLHNRRKRILIIFDEASGIDDAIWTSQEGVLLDEETEIIWLAFGNPTQNTGRFRECFGKFKHRWKTFQIDSRTVEGTNKVQIGKWIEDYGEDSDFVRVRVRGEFPRSGSNQFISSDSVSACRRYKAESYQTLPKIIAVDVARFGDDESVIGMRQGRKVTILAKYRGLDTAQLSERVIEFIKAEAPDATVIDGVGIGAGVVDHLRFRGFTNRLFEFNAGAAANDSAMYYNRGTECWGIMRDWLAAGAEIPDDPELADQLTTREYYFSTKSQIQLEKKEDMKARGLSSPDVADMLAMTFSVTIAAPPPPQPIEYRHPGQDQHAWMGI